ncbi:MAG: hypothetical protein H0U10_10180 [Chloroflexia bacterium]|nr:hypothetical protein [Chloroflexia bacterium]
MAQRNPAPDLNDGSLDILSDVERWALFDADARRMFAITGEEFLRRWDAGAYRGLAEDTLEGRRVNDMVFSLLIVSPERVDVGHPPVSP